MPDGGDSKVSAADDAEKKKLRNRLSQRAFRRRQAECIRELQSRVSTAERPDSERIEALQLENRQLRSQLLQVQAKMSRLIASMQTMNDAVSKTLDDATIGTKGEEEEPGSSGAVEGSAGQPPVESTIPTSVSVRGSGSASGFTPVEPVLPQDAFDASNLDFSFTSIDESQHANLGSRADYSSTELVNVSGISPLHPQIPNIWSFEYQMGVQPYLAAMTAAESSSLIRGKEWNLSNSPFSDHILLLQHLLKSKLNASGFALQGPYQLQALYQPVLMVLSMFNSITRPDVMAWYAKTRFYHIVELTAWQLYPCATTFDKLHPRYRPTEIQKSHLHPCVIDWIPFPAIRDRCIQLHAANPQVDQIFCDAVTGYTVEATMSDLILGAPHVKVYIRVTDLITAMSMSSGSVDKDSASVTLPAPDSTTLFSSPAYARAAFKKLNMDKGASYYKIDPSFFEKYPELYDRSSDLTASGIPLRPQFQKILTYPRPLDGSTVETYRSFIDFSMDAASIIASYGNT